MKSRIYFLSAISTLKRINFKFFFMLRIVKVSNFFYTSVSFTYYTSVSFCTELLPKYKSIVEQTNNDGIFALLRGFFPKWKCTYISAGNFLSIFPYDFVRDVNYDRDTPEGWVRPAEGQNGASEPRLYKGRGK